MYESAHDLSYFSESYKVLDIPNALEYAEGRKRGLPYVVENLPTQKRRQCLPAKAPVPSVVKRPTGVAAPIQKNKPSPVKRPTRLATPIQKNKTFSC